MRRVSIASGSQLSADAGAAVADAGGNAVDAAIAAMVTAMCTDPGVIAPGSGGFIVVAEHGNHPVVIDAYVEMPGRGAPEEAWGSGTPVFMQYGGATRTVVGYGSVATPGMFAGLDLAASRYGSMPWSALMQPAIEAVEAGFALSQASGDYIAYSHDVVFGWDPPSRAVLHHEDGSHLREGDHVVVPDLADSLRAIADEGVGVLYEGDLGARIVDSVAANGGLLTRADLEAYEPIVRLPAHFDMHPRWVDSAGLGEAGEQAEAFMKLAVEEEEDPANRPTSAEMIDRHFEVLVRDLLERAVAEGKTASWEP